jgi:FAD/FMN-containing dehydrogenase
MKFLTADPTLTEAQVKALYWGSQYARLADLKRKYDPGNVFSSPQSIKAVVWR